MNYVNLTPHAIVLNDGRKFVATGVVARVASSYTSFTNDVCSTVYGEMSNLPAPAPDTRYIVSGMVLAALAGSRTDVVAPATGHPECVRNDAGHIVSVPGFTR